MDTEEFDISHKCPYGFTCSNMPKLPPSDAISEDCANLSKCNKAAKYGSRTLFPYGAFEEIKSRFLFLRRTKRKLSKEEKRELEEKRSICSFVWSMERHEKAVSTLNRRSKTTWYSDFGIAEQISLVEKKLKQLSSNLYDNYSIKLFDIYIAPEGVEVNSYSVKRPSPKSFPQNTLQEEIRKNQKTYHYHQLKSKTAQFKSEEEKGKKCKVIHLGRSDDEKNIQARLGIERRNRLSKIRTKLIQAQTAIEEAEKLAEWEFSFDEIVKNSNKQN